MDGVERSGQSADRHHHAGEEWNCPIFLSFFTSFPTTDGCWNSVQTNEVNQGDALEHNFSAVHAALLLPVTHLLHGEPLQPVSSDVTCRVLPASLPPQV